RDIGRTCHIRYKDIGTVAGVIVGLEPSKVGVNGSVDVYFFYNKEISKNIPFDMVTELFKHITPKF
ncbi:MAG: hypothetical protein PHV42_04605, partial [Candidatus Pacebacteria bacterium]|nr:hypothetical protein [Candidatus Paceibacterota bacterium]